MIRGRRHAGADPQRGAAAGGSTQPRRHGSRRSGQRYLRCPHLRHSPDRQRLLRRSTSARAVSDPLAGRCGCAAVSVRKSVLLTRDGGAAPYDDARKCHPIDRLCHTAGGDGRRTSSPSYRRQPFAADADELHPRLQQQLLARAPRQRHDGPDPAAALDQHLLRAARRRAPRHRALDAADRRRGARRSARAWPAPMPATCRPSWITSRMS